MVAGEWLADEQFAGACGVRGKPGWPPSRLALVTIFQMAEDLTGRLGRPAHCPARRLAAPARITSAHFHRRRREPHCPARYPLGHRHRP
jgi:hypothetical protein